MLPFRMDRPAAFQILYRLRDRLGEDYRRAHDRLSEAGEEGWRRRARVGLELAALDLVLEEARTSGLRRSAEFPDLAVDNPSSPSAETQGTLFPAP